MKNRRVFPVKNIRKGSRVVLYGAGHNGLEMYKQNMILQWCIVDLMVDRNYEEISGCPIKINGPQILKEIEFDYILITIENPEIRLQVFNELFDMGIDLNKIVIDIDYFVTDDVCGDIIAREDRPDAGDKLRIGFLPGGVMGDNIISLRLYQELIRIVPESLVDVFTTFTGFPERVFWGQKNLRRIIHRRPAVSDRNEYDLIIQSHFEPSLIFCNLQRIESISPHMAECIFKLYEYQSSDFFMCNPAQYMNRIQWDRSKFMGFDCYTLLGSSGAFNIENHYIEFPTDESYFEEYTSLGLNRQYITFSYGVSDPLKNGRQQTKMWPKENYIDLIHLIRESFPDIELVQLDAGNIERVPGADKYVMGENLEIVKHILKNAICHIDCEGGLVHMATQLGTKCFVVFGPTPVSFFGYKENTNFAPKVCGECCGIIKDWYTRCYKYGDARCMASTTAEEVFVAIKDYLNGKNPLYNQDFLND